MVRKAEELAKKHGWFLARQFENPANPAYHRQTTGPEILSDFAGRRLDFFVTGWGTGGTLTGAGEMIRLARPEVQDRDRDRAGGRLAAGGRRMEAAQDPGLDAGLRARPCSIASVPHEIVPVTDEESIAAARALARSEGIFCGISSGGTFAAALKVAAKAPARLGRSWRCCRIPPSATCRRRCSRVSPRARTRSLEDRAGRSCRRRERWDNPRPLPAGAASEPRIHSHA